MPSGIRTCQTHHDVRPGLVLDAGNREGVPRAHDESERAGEIYGVVAIKVRRQLLFHGAMGVDAVPSQSVVGRSVESQG